MKQLTYMVLCIFLAAFMAGCTQNNGDIGPWFGTWRLDEILIDGDADENYRDNIIWKFQSDVISIVEVDDVNHEANPSWGTWLLGDNTITLEFVYSDDIFGNSSDRYTPPAATHIPAGATTMRVEKLTKGEIILSYQSADCVYTYYLKKHG